MDVPESIGKTHHYRRECPSEHHAQLCQEDFQKMLVEDKAVEKIEEVVRQYVKVALESIKFEC